MRLLSLVVLLLAAVTVSAAEPATRPAELRLPRSGLLIIPPAGLAAQSGSGELLDPDRHGMLWHYHTSRAIDEAWQTASEQAATNGVAPVAFTTDDGGEGFRQTFRRDDGSLLIRAAVAWAGDWGYHDLRLSYGRPSDAAEAEAVEAMRSLRLDPEARPWEAPDGGLSERGVIFNPPAGMFVDDDNGGYLHSGQVWFHTDPRLPPQLSSQFEVNEAIPSDVASIAPLPEAGSSYDFDGPGESIVLERTAFETIGGRRGVEIIGGRFTGIVPRVTYEAQIEWPARFAGEAGQVVVLKGEGFGGERDRWLAVFRKVARSVRAHQPGDPLPPDVLEAVKARQQREADASASSRSIEHR